jgi:hypothetical protein
MPLLQAQWYSVFCIPFRGLPKQIMMATCSYVNIISRKFHESNSYGFCCSASLFVCFNNLLHFCNRYIYIYLNYLPFVSDYFKQRVNLWLLEVGTVQVGVRREGQEEYIKGRVWKN